MKTEQLHEDLRPIISTFKNYKAPRLEKLSVSNARNLPTLNNAVAEQMAVHLSARAIGLVKPSPEPVGEIEHILIPAFDGQLLARVYHPSAKHERTGDYPVVVYFHGGGWVIANLDTYDASCRALCNTLDAVVVSVAYRQAPEHPFPAATEDAYFALQWVLQNASSLHGNPAQVVVAGESAGGNLATVACLLSKERKARVPVGQLLIYPVVDATTQRPSYVDNVDTLPLNAAMMDWFFKHYLPEDALRHNPLVSPYLADVSNLPAAFVLTAEFDPLRDEGRDYAIKLQKAGVETQHHDVLGVVHEFFGLSGVVKPAKDSLKQIADWFDRLVGRNS